MLASDDEARAIMNKTNSSQASSQGLIKQDKVTKKPNFALMKKEDKNIIAAKTSKRSSGRGLGSVKVTPKSSPKRSKVTLTKPIRKALEDGNVYHNDLNHTQQDLNQNFDSMREPLGY